MCYAQSYSQHTSQSPDDCERGMTGYPNLTGKASTWPRVEEINREAEKQVVLRKGRKSNRLHLLLNFYIASIHQSKVL